MDPASHILQLIAGVCFFMFGLGLASDNLQVLAADRMRAFMIRVNQHRLYGVLAGAGLTAIMQSSSAVTVMLVNLASAGVVTLQQVMGMIIGTTIGTTLTVQLISFDVTSLGVYFVIGGFSLMFLSRKKKLKEIGAVIFGFGLLFYGLLLMNQAVTVFKDVSEFKQFFTYLSHHPMTTFFITTLFTAFVHSSAVTIGIAMTLSVSQLISPIDSMIWIYGANLGTTATALVASLSGGHAGRQVAVAHFLYKAFSILLFVAFTSQFSELVALTSSDAGRQIANAHTFLNIIAAFVLYPLIGVGATYIEKMMPRPDSEKEFGARYLDPGSFRSPAMAFANAVREVQRMGDYALTMTRLSIRAFERDDPDFTDEIKGYDWKIDVLNREIKLFLVRLTDEPLTEAQKSKVVTLITLVNDIENIGDVIDKNVIPLARKKSNLKLSFSQEGWREVVEFHELVVDNFERALSAFALNSRDLALEVVKQKSAIRIAEQKLREAHISRLNRKLPESINTSNIHLDLLSAFRRVNSYACNLVYLTIFGDGAIHFPNSSETDDSDVA
ncbi:MAG: Na/Pi cotransporter family protein [Oligoflexia bacterium]|nr:Na/Pi cotransporter family protein [Oligoflexia bacterium]